MKRRDFLKAAAAVAVGAPLVSAVPKSIETYFLDHILFEPKTFLLPPLQPIGPMMITPPRGGILGWLIDGVWHYSTVAVEASMEECQVFYSWDEYFDHWNYRRGHPVEYHGPSPTTLLSMENL